MIVNLSKILNFFKELVNKNEAGKSCIFQTLNHTISGTILYKINDIVSTLRCLHPGVASYTVKPVLSGRSKSRLKNGFQD